MCATDLTRQKVTDLPIDDSSMQMSTLLMHVAATLDFVVSLGRFL